MARRFTGFLATAAMLACSAQVDPTTTQGNPRSPEQPSEPPGNRSSEPPENKDGSAPRGAVPAQVASDIAAAITPYVDVTGAPGKAVGAVVQVETKGYGGTHPFGAIEVDGAPVTGKESWVMGSVSKVMTAYVVAERVTAGAIALGDPITSHLPAGWTAQAGPDGKEITIEHVLTHSSGLPFDAPRLAQAMKTGRGLEEFTRALEQYSSDDLKADLAGTKLATSPGSAFTYSNLGFMVAQAVVEHDAGKTYDALLAASFGGLGAPSIMGPAVMPKGLPLMIGHSGSALSPTRVARTQAVTGAGFALGSGADFGRLLRLFARIDAPPSDLFARSRDLMEVPRLAHDAQGTPVNQGLALGIIPTPTATLYKKNGRASGYTSVFLYDPKREIGVAVGLNVAPAKDTVNRAVCQILGTLAKDRGAPYDQATLTACETGL